CISYCFFFSSRRRHTRFSRDWSSDVCSSDLGGERPGAGRTQQYRCQAFPETRGAALSYLRLSTLPARVWCSRRPLLPELVQSGKIGRASCREREEGRGEGSGTSNQWKRDKRK